MPLTILRPFAYLLLLSAVSLIVTAGFGRKDQFILIGAISTAVFYWTAYDWVPIVYSKCKRI